MHSIESLELRDRSYVVAYTDISVPGKPIAAALPRNLTPGQAVEFSLFTGPRPLSSAEAEVALTFAPEPPEQERRVCVTLNGQEPAGDNTFSPSALHGGYNTICVTNTGDATCEIRGVELSLRFPPIQIVLIGDSTVASYAHPPDDRPDLTGWGQVFGERFNDRVNVLNHARSGASSKSFIGLGLWEKAIADGADYIFIQFGHNDCPGKGDRSTDPDTDYSDNLRQYIDETRAAGAKPILVTPVSRRTFENERIHTTLQPLLLVSSSLTLSVK